MAMSRICRPCIPTMSLGHGDAGHDMPTKLQAAKDAGFEGVEIFYMCLESFAKQMPDTTPKDRLRAAARQTGIIAKRLGLVIVVLQPILNYDGIRDKAEHAARIEEITFRMELCTLLGTDMMQIPANFRLDDGITGDEQAIVNDLRELADIGLTQTPPIRLVYEAMCWSTYAWRWQDSWRLVKAVDRPNFGLVLDAFHIAGWEFADPTIEGGIRPDGSSRLEESLKELMASVDGKRIFYVQLVDAEKQDLPIAKDTGNPYYNPSQQPRMSWSRNCRVFPYEEDRGAHMPIEQVCKTFLETGFSGWISFELFNRFISSDSPDIPQDHAKRGWKSWTTLKKNLAL